MALPGAAQCGRNPAHGALAGDREGGADDCGGVHSLDGAGARGCAFALVVLATDGVPGARGGGDVAGTLPAAIDNGFSSGGARGGYRMPSADLKLHEDAATGSLSFLLLRYGAGGICLGI